MPRELKGNFNYLIAYSRRLLIIFWSILLGLLVVTLIMNYAVFNEGIIEFQLSFPLYAVSAVIGQQLVKNGVSYLIQMGATRKSIFKSMGVFFLGVSFINAVLASVVYSVATALFGENIGSRSTVTVSGAGEQIISFNHFADLIENTLFSRIVVDISLMFLLFVCGFIVGLIFYKFGTIIGVSSIAIVVFTFMIGMARGWLVNFFLYIFSNLDLIFFLKVLLFSVIIYLLSYLLLRRLSIA